MFEVPVLNENNEKILCEMNGKNADMLMSIKVKYLKKGEQITSHSVRFIVTAVEGHRIEKIKVIVPNYD